jgi:hypothetical protein
LPNVVHAHIGKEIVVLKKIAYIVVAGGLVLAAQAAAADDTQFDVGGGRYQGVAALPFTSVPPTGVEAPMAAAPQRLESTHAGPAVTEHAPAPYNVPGGYFN